MDENRSRHRWLATLGSIVIIATTVTCSSKSNSVTGPNPTMTPIPAAPTATPVPGGNPTATPVPRGNPTPTPVPGKMNATVNVGQGGGTVFMDQMSGNSTTTISAGGTVTWTWVSGTHSTTSGTCSGGIYGGGCTSDGIWDSGINSGGSFTHTFPSAGTFPYFCRVHGAMMQGTVIVH